MQKSLSLFEKVMIILLVAMNLLVWAWVLSPVG